MKRGWSLNSVFIGLFILNALFSTKIWAQEEAERLLNLDSLKTVLQNEKNDTSRLCLFLLIGKQEQIEQPEQALADWKKGFSFAESLITNGNSLVAKRAQTYLGLFDYQTAFCLQNQGKIDQALEYYEKALVRQKKNNDLEPLAYTLNNLAGIYYNTGNMEVALDYFNQCMKIQKSIHDSMGIAYSLNNIAGVYLGLGRDGNLTEEERKNYILKSFPLMEQSLGIRQRIQYLYGVAECYLNLGTAHELLGEFDQALVYWEKACKIQEEGGFLFPLTYTLNNICGIYWRKKEYLKALFYGEKSMKYSKQLGFPDAIMNSAGILSKVYRAAGKHNEALAALELHFLMRDSIHRESNRRASLKSQLKHEYEKKAAADSIRQLEEKNILETEIKQEQTRRVALFFGLFLIFVFAVFMVNRFRVARKQKKLIEEQTRLVEEQKYMVEMKQQEILDSIHYAKRIQIALITSDYNFKKSLDRAIY